MQAGALRHRVTIQTRVTAVDSYGGPTETWEDLATVWAEVCGVSGREYFAGDQRQAEATMKVYIRYREDVSPLDRVLYGGKKLDVRAVLPDNRKVKLLLLCAEASHDQDA